MLKLFEDLLDKEFQSISLNQLLPLNKHNMLHIGNWETIAYPWKSPGGTITQIIFSMRLIIPQH
jgi:hypothetical protein